MPATLIGGGHSYTLDSMSNDIAYIVFWEDNVSYYATQLCDHEEMTAVLDRLSQPDVEYDRMHVTPVCPHTYQVLN